jgi:ribosome-binding protein aMBF1 (putative translation factor)
MEEQKNTPPSEGTKTCKCCGRELPIGDFFKNKWGITDVCKECANKHRADKRAGRNEVDELRKQVDQARTLRLSDFTPRELMAELKRRGYDGKITYTRIETIDLSTI